jgi:ABC-2 type transport system permease protein
MKAFLCMSITEFRLSIRNFVYMFFAFVFPPMMLLLFGGIYGNDPTSFYNGHGSVDVMTPGYIGMILAVSGIMGLPMQLAEYRQHKVLKRFKATPISSGTIMIPHFAVNSVLCAIGTLILIIVGKLVFNLHFLGNIFYFIVAYILSMLCIFSIGFLIAAIAPNNRAASAIAYLIYFPMLFLSGATMPLQLMPKAIVAISKFIPLTYCVEILQGTWMGDPLRDFVKAIIILTAITVLCTGVSIKIFRWE